MRNGYQKYKNTSVESANREKLLLMMYEGAIKFTKRAILACEKDDIAERGINIGRTYDIINELNSTLNHEVGGHIAADLEQLYMYITDKLTQANIDGETKHLNDALKVIETLYDGWQQAIEKVKKQQEAGKNNTGTKSA